MQYIIYKDPIYRLKANNPKLSVYILFFLKMKDNKTKLISTIKKIKESKNQAS